MGEILLSIFIGSCLVFCGVVLWKILNKEQEKFFKNH